MQLSSLFSKLAPMGVAALGAVAATGIATAPAQAVILGPGSIGYSGFDISSFLDDVGPNDFSITINSDEVDVVFGSFADLLNPGDPIANTPITFMFDYIPNSGDGTTADPWLYNLDGDVEIEFETVENQILTHVIPDGSQFNAVKAGQTAEVELCSQCFGDPYWEYQGMNTPASSGIQFEQSGDATEFEVTSTVGVPEPTSLLGILAVGGLGLGMKRKKQA